MRIERPGLTCAIAAVSGLLVAGVVGVVSSMSAERTGTLAFSLSLIAGCFAWTAASYSRVPTEQRRRLGSRAPGSTRTVLMIVGFATMAGAVIFAVVAAREGRLAELLVVSVVFSIYVVGYHLYQRRLARS